NPSEPSELLASAQLAEQANWLSSLSLLIDICARTVVLPVGYKKDPGCRAWETEAVFEQDIPIPLRDGVVIRADVFRPADMSLVPAIVHYSPYGKSGTGLFDLDLIPGRAGIPRSAVSGFQSFEAFDPAEWVAHGYAVVNVDARGVFGP
ncbi:Peptidase-S15 domain-containing protein, partial [Pyrenophora tritici-repentis]